MSTTLRRAWGCEIKQLDSKLRMVIFDIETIVNCCHKCVSGLFVDVIFFLWV